MPNLEDSPTKLDLVLAQLEDESSILSIVDPFTVYSYYIEESIGLTDIMIEDNFRSPLREDDTNPSFRLFYGKHEVLYFSDYGDKNRTGNVVDFVAQLYKVTREEALHQIVADFGLGTEQAKLQLPTREQRSKLKKELGIKPKPFTKTELAFWNSFHIGLSTLKRYNVTSVDLIFWDGSPIKPKSSAFAYGIGIYWKVYQPFDEKHRFISSYPRNYVEGALQLRNLKKLLLITKSLKDVMLLHEMGYEAISPKSENTVIPAEILSKLTALYEKIIVFFDNDGKHKAEDYPYPSIELPIGGPKDISDYAKKYGINEAKKILNKLICY